MTIALTSTAEDKAQAAENLAPYGGLKLLHIKRQLSELLRLIGNESIFAEYTVHDIRHIDSMLGSLDWLIPIETQAKMSPSDWLMIVLGIYFHDLGMLVTRDEFDHRETSGFPEYRTRRLLTNDAKGMDYSHRIDAFEATARERFLYQEYVRENHARRIRSWLEDPGDIRLGAAQSAAQAIFELLSPLPRTFRNDLGKVCESHHLDDLDDESKYRVRRRYGNTAAEIVDLQYAAVLLRTADLLHITQDRTPSIAFRAINPSNPKSIEEWQKQIPVVAVSSRIATDDDGNLNPALPRDTVEVEADFTDPSGFFSLTSYLSYASSQLALSHSWIEESRRKYGTEYEFPWRSIDQRNIHTEGFMARQFAFEIDQYKVLELLTGHTLYNDTNVVIRELTQNAIDAVRLQNADPSGRRSANAGDVRVHWNSTTRELSVLDNGTGMTQDMIEKNFLRVGASRYQEPRFVEAHPNFDPISRFGIGVLSAFMIADSVEVVTVHPEESQARHLALSDVHGRYLIRLLDKADPSVPTSLKEHGTCIRLHVRASADMESILKSLSYWFVLPGCALTCQVNEEEVKPIGFTNLKSALEAELVAADYAPATGSLEVHTETVNSVEVAYAVRWSAWYKEWEFVTTDWRFDRHSLVLGTCVQGVRVDRGTPGFTGHALAAMANSSGPRAPKTNVARNAIEETPEYKETLTAVYTAYLRHVQRQMDDLAASGDRSKGWIAQECQFLTAPLLRVIPEDVESRENGPKPTDANLLKLAARNLPFYAVDNGSERELRSLADLRKSSQYLSSQSMLLDKAGSLLRSLPGDITLRALLTAGNLEVSVPDGEIIDLGHGFSRWAFLDEWEVAGFSGSEADGTLNATYKPIADSRRWRILSGGGQPITLEGSGRFVSRSSRAAKPLIFLPAGEMELQGLDDYQAVAFGDGYYLLPGRPWESLLEATPSLIESYFLARAFAEVIGLAARSRSGISYSEELADYLRDEVFKEVPARLIDLREQALVSLQSLREATRVFNPGSWMQRDGYDYF